MNEEAIKALYEAILGDYEVGTIDEFKAYLSDDIKRVKFFEEVIKPKYDVQSLDQFESTYGLKKKVDSTLEPEDTVSTTEVETTPGSLDSSEEIIIPNAPKRNGTVFLENQNDEESTHLMAAEQLEDGNWVGFPRLFQNEDGTWVDDFVKGNWEDAYNEAKSRGEVVDFGKDSKSALAYGEGSWKDSYNKNKGKKLLSDGFDPSTLTAPLEDGSIPDPLKTEAKVLSKLEIDPIEFNNWKEKNLRAESKRYKFFKQMLLNNEGEQYEDEQKIQKQITAFLAQKLKKNLEAIDAADEESRKVLIEENRKDAQTIINNLKAYKKETITDDLESRKKLLKRQRAGGIKMAASTGFEMIKAAGNAAANFAMGTGAALFTEADALLNATGADKKGALLGISEMFLDAAEAYNLDAGETQRSTFVQGKEVISNGKTYIVSDEGTVYDEETHIKVDDILSESEVSSIKNKASKIKGDSTSFDMGSGLTGLTSTLVNLFGLIRGGQKLQKSIGVSPKVGMGIMSFSSTVASSVQSVKEDLMAQGVSEKEATNKGLVFGSAIATLDGVFSSLAGSNEKLLGSTKVVKDLLMDLAKTKGKEFSTQQLKRKVRDLIKENAKELFIEEIPVLLSERGINNAINYSVGMDVRAGVEDLKRADFMETAFLTLGATTGMGSTRLITSNQRNDVVRYLSNNVKDVDIVSNKLVTDGLLTQEEADKTVSEIKSMQYAENKVSGAVKTTENMIEAAALIEKKEKLISERENTDPSLRSDIDKRIDSIDQQLEQLKEKDNQDVQDIINGEKDGDIKIEVTREEAVAALKAENEANERLGLPTIIESEANILKTQDKLMKEKQKSIKEGQPETQTDTDQDLDTNGNLDNITKDQKELFGETHSDERLPYGKAKISNITTADEKGVSTATYTNPETGSVDAIISSKDKKNFVGYIRVYENGKPTNKFSAKMESTGTAFKNMITSADATLPNGARVIETTTISEGGLKSFNNSNLDVEVDADGNVVTNTTKYSDATKESVEEKGQTAYNAFKTDDKAKAEAEVEKIKKAYPGIEVKIKRQGTKRGRKTYTIDVELPVLIKNNKTETQKDESEQTVSEINETKKFQDNDVVLKEETFTITDEDGGKQEVTVKTYLDGSLSKADSVSFDADGNQIRRKQVKLADNDVVVRDGLTAQEQVEFIYAGDGYVMEKTSERSGNKVNNPKKIDQLTTEQKQKLGIETETQEVASPIQDNLQEEESKTKKNPEKALEKAKNDFEQSEKALADRVKKPNLKERVRLIREKFLDRQTRVKDLLKGIGNKKATKAKNLLVTKAGATGLSNFRFKKADDEIYKGLKDKDLKALNNIIYLRRLKAINENRRDQGKEPYVGINDTDYDTAVAALKGYENELGDKKYKDLSSKADKYFDTMNESLTRMKDSGLISEEVFNQLKDVDYSPIKTLDYIIPKNADAAEIDRMAEISGINANVIKTLSDKNLKDIIMDTRWLLSSNLGMIEAKVFENKMLNAFNEAVESAEGDVKSEIEKYVLPNPVVGETKEGNPKRKYDKKTPPGFTKVNFKKNGVNKYMVIDNAYANQLLDIKKNSNTSVVGDILVKKPVDILRFFATSGNPLFIVGNTAVDFANILFLSDVYSNNKFKGGAELAFDFVKTFGSKVGGTKEYKKIYEEFMEHGGAMDYLSTDGLKAIEGMRGKGKVSNAASKAMKGWGNFMSYLGEASEVSFRVAVYSKVKNKLLKDFNKENDREPSKEEMENIMFEASREARETIDFSQGGSMVKAADKVLPYLNAGTQGLRKGIDYAAKNPKGFASSMLQAMVMAGGASAASMFMLLRSFDDDEDPKKILDVLNSISDYEKSNYHILFTGEKDKDGEHKYIRIKKLPTIGIASTIAEQLTIKAILKSRGIDYEVNDEALKKSASGISPIDVGQGIPGLINRNPLAAASLTYIYNYDHFYGQDVFKGPRNKKILPSAEGLLDDRVDQIYKDLGQAFGFSPKRSKAAVEKIITSETTNPSIGLIYSGYDKMRGLIGETPTNNEIDNVMSRILKNTERKLVRSTNKKLLDYKKEDELKKIEAEIETGIYLKEQKAYNDIRKRYENNDPFTNQEFKEYILDNFPRIDAKKYAKKYVAYIKNMNGDKSILDIVFEDTPEVQAYRIYEKFGDSFDDDEKREILKVFKAAKRKFSKKALYIYNKKYRKK